jgi:AcrR family transcriptional regulator
MGEFDGITMSDIAREAGVGKGTLYRHFTDKAELCHALLDEAMRDFQARTLERLGAPESAYDKLRWFVRESAVYVDRHMLLLREAAAQTSPGGTLAHPAHYWWRQTIYGLLEQHNQTGDLDYLTDVLYVMLDIQTLHFQRHLQGYTLERVIQGLFATLERLVTQPES